MNKPAFIITDNSLTAILNGKPFSMQISNPSFEAAKDALAEERYSDLEAMFDTAKAVVDFAEGNMTVLDGQVFYKDTPIHNHVVDRIFAFMKDGLPYKPLLRFLDKLMENPSRRAVSELYAFLEHKSMPLTPDGNFLAYKSVRENWTDHHTGKFSNKVGSVLEMVRNQVCDDANVGCSFGYHCGSIAYCKGFGGSGSRLLIVEVNPADVVSVPLDCECQKLRTAKYKVVAEFERPLDEALNDSYGDYDEEDSDYDDYDDCDDCEEDCDECPLKPVVSEATRQKLREAALRQKRDLNGKFI